MNKLKLLLIDNSEELFNALINKIKGTFTRIERSKSLPTTDFDGFVIITDKQVKKEDITELNIKAEKIIFAVYEKLSKVESRSLKTLCQTKDVILCNVINDSQLIEFISNIVKPYQVYGDKIVTFFSSSPNIGSTALSLSVAESIQQKNPNLTIGLLSINPWSSGDSHLNNYKGKYLNEIKEALTLKSFNKDSFYEVFHKQRNLFILAGNKDIKKERFFTIEEINYLLELSKESFDVVLVDAGSHFDNAVMFSALSAARFHFVVANQQEKGVERFKLIYDDVLFPLGHEKDNFFLVINGINEALHLPSSKDLAKRYEIPLLVDIPYLSFGMSCEREKKSLYQVEEPIYNKKIDVISKTIMDEFGLKISAGKKKKRLFSFAGGSL